MPSAFVCMGDLHLSSNVWRTLPEIRADAVKAWHALVDVAVKNKVPLVLAGDVFDSKTPNPESCAAFVSGCRNLDDAGLSLYFIQGQHERAGPPAWCEALFSKAVHMESKSFSIGDCCVFGFDNRGPGELQEDLKKVPKRVSVLVLHQSCIGSHISGNFDPAWIPDHVNLVLMGDIHTTWEKRIERSTDIPLSLAYTGSLSLQSVSEPTEKSCLLVDSDLSYTRIPLPSREMVKYRVKTLDELQIAVDAVLKSRPDILSVVQYDKEIPGADKLLKKASGKLLRSTPFSSVLESSDVAFDPTSPVDLVSAVNDLFKDRNNPEVKDLCLLLVNVLEKGGDVKSCIEDWYLSQT